MYLCLLLLGHSPLALPLFAASLVWLGGLHICPRGHGAVQKVYSQHSWLPAWQGEVIED